jgi:N-acetylglutamate synthase-like GNAT family acetyltransferase
LSALDLAILTRNDTDAAKLEHAANAVFDLFLARHEEFGFGADVTAHYPDIADPTTSAFLADPVSYIAQRIAASRDPIGRVVLLTTHGDRTLSPLAAAGYGDTAIVMPAGPDFAVVSMQMPGNGRTLYVEAVDEADPDVLPDFVLELRDGEGGLRGGACGSIGGDYAYLSIMALDAGLPRQTGRKLAQALLGHLRHQSVKIVHLGTQTAGPFYAKLGFATTHTVLPRLRTRRGTDGRQVATDLQMMELTL